MPDVLIRLEDLDLLADGDENEALLDPAGRVRLETRTLAEDRLRLDESLVDHAKSELERAGLFDKDSDYEGMLGDSLLKVVELFADQGHSGMSAAMSIGALEKLLRFEPLTPLTSDPEEWMHVAGPTTQFPEQDDLWQSRRNPAAFSKDGGKTWDLLEAVESLLLEEAVLGYIKKKWDEKHHPRWPKGAMDPITGESRAGEFMKKGQWFESGGKKWQITSTAGGKVEAIQASGSKTEVEHRIFEPKQGAGGAVVKEATPLQKPSIFDRNTSPVVSPYVDPASHDPSIKKPESSKLSDADWKRFGKLDQEYYVELMDRFGGWNPAASKSLTAEIYSSYDSSLQQVFSKAFGGNKGSTGFWESGAGQWLNLAYLLKSAGGNPAGAWKKYQKAKEAFDDLMEATHWDLYNRSKAPDIVLFHGSQQSAQANKDKYVSGKEPIYAGYSQSYALTGAQSWGSTILATPTAVRHIAMSYFTPLPGGSSCWGEQEIAVGVRMKLDDRSVVFGSHDFGVGGVAAKQAIQKWLTGLSSNQPVGGHIIQELKDVWAGKGSIPIPPEPPGLTPILSGEKQYEELPPDIGQQAVQMVKGLQYKVPAGEEPTPEGAESTLETMGLKPGDFIEGLKGTRYIIVADAGDPTAGLRYVKVMDKSGTPLGAPSYGSSYQFNASAGNKFRRLDGHLDIPKKKKLGFTPFGPEQYEKLVPGQLKMMTDFKPGEMLKHEGEGFKVVGPGPGGKVQVQSLDTGKDFTLNSLYKAQPLIPKEGYVPPPETWIGGDEYKPEQEGELVRVEASGSTVIGVYAGHEDNDGNPVVTLPVLGDQPVVPDSIQKFDSPEVAPGSYEPGDVFYADGKKHVVTSVLKSGVVRARPQGEKVFKFDKKFMATRTVIRPGTFKPGAKKKLKEFEVGDLFSGSGAKVRPYMVVANFSAKEIHAQNLETGEIVPLSGNKSWHSLVHVDAEQEPLTDEHPAHPPDLVSTLPQNGSAYEPVGEPLHTSKLEVGDKFTTTSQAGPGKVVDQVWMVVGPDSVEVIAGAPGDIGKNHDFATSFSESGMVIHPVEVKAAPEPPKIDTPIHTLKVGDQFEFGSGSKWEVIEEGGGDFGPTIKRIDKAGSYTGMEKTLTPTQSSTVVKVLKKAAAPQPVEPSKFDADLYAGTSGSPALDPAHDGDEIILLADEPEGTIFLSASGLPMQLKSKPKSGGTAIALHNGKTVKGIDLDKGFKKLVPKEDLAQPLEIEQAKEGDWIPLSKLGVGDQYKYGEGYAPVEIMSVPDAGDEHVMVASVAEDGNTIGSPKPAQFSKNTPVVLVKKAGDPAPGGDPDAAKFDLDTSGLQAVPEYTTYLHAKSGKNKYPLVSAMPAGTYFKDKDGRKFLVKQPAGHGDIVVATPDGDLFTIDGNMRGKVSDGMLFVDTSDHVDVDPGDTDLYSGTFEPGTVVWTPVGPWPNSGQKAKVVGEIKKDWTEVELDNGVTDSFVTSDLTTYPPDEPSVPFGSPYDDSEEGPSFLLLNDKAVVEKALGHLAKGYGGELAGEMAASDGMNKSLNQRAMNAIDAALKMSTSNDLADKPEIQQAHTALEASGYFPEPDQMEAGPDPSEGPDPSVYVWSGGKPVYLDNGEPIKKGGTYYAGSSTTPVTVLGSGNEVGSVKVDYPDSGTVDILPTFLTPAPEQKPDLIPNGTPISAMEDGTVISADGDTLYIVEQPGSKIWHSADGVTKGFQAEASSDWIPMYVKPAPTPEGASQIGKLNVGDKFRNETTLGGKVVAAFPADAVLTVTSKDETKNSMKITSDQPMEGGGKAEMVFAIDSIMGTKSVNPVKEKAADVPPLMGPSGLPIHPGDVVQPQHDAVPWADDDEWFKVVSVDPEIGELTITSNVSQDNTVVTLADVTEHHQMGSPDPSPDESLPQVSVPHSDEKVYLSTWTAAMKIFAEKQSPGTKEWSEALTDEELDAALAYAMKTPGAGKVAIALNAEKHERAMKEAPEEFFTPQGGFVAVSSLPEWGVGLTKSGKYVYKAGAGAPNPGMLFYLGSHKKAQVKQVTPVSFPQPDPAATQKTGDKPLAAMQPGEMFSTPNGFVWQVIANGPDGITGKSVTGPEAIAYKSMDEARKYHVPVWEEMSAPAEAEAEEVTPPVIPIEAWNELDHIKVGAVVEFNGERWEVMGTDEYTVLVQNLKTGEQVEHEFDDEGYAGAEPVPEDAPPVGEVGEWVTGSGWTSVPPEFTDNPDGKKIKDLPPGAFYAFEDDIEPGTYDIKQIQTPWTGYSGPSVETTDGGLPSIDYVPEYVWLPPSPAVDPADNQFFQQLANGDKAQFNDKILGISKPVTVVNNQVPGLGILVQDKTGDQFQADPGELTPIGGEIQISHVSEMEVGDTYVAAFSDPEPLSLTWKVTAKHPDGSATVVLQDTKGKVDFDIGHEGKIDGPIDVKVRRSLETEEETEPQMTDAFAALQPGAHFTAAGATWEKVGGGMAKLLAVNDPNQKASPGTLHEFPGDEQVVWLQGVAPGEAKVGYAYALSPGAKFTLPGGEMVFTVASKSGKGVDAEVTTEDGQTIPAGTVVEFLAEPPVEDPLDPYLHPKSGKYKYDALKGLAPGTVFTDKKKKEYSVIGHSGSQTIYADPEGNQYVTSSSNRVKVKGGDTIFAQEARVIYTSAGGVRRTA